MNMCAYQRKSWVEKRDIDKSPEVKRTDKKFTDILPGERMLIATPKIVDNYIRHIPKGKEATLLQMRKDLAAAYLADKTCPVTSGIFLRIVAEAAYEEYKQGKPLPSITPFWRMIDISSPTAKKLSFGTDFLVSQRKKEGLSKEKSKKREQTVALVS
jgi:hypothetical protein